MRRIEMKRLALAFLGISFTVVGSTPNKGAF